MTVPTANYERQIPATLIVRLDNGEQFEATTEDLERFGLVERTNLTSEIRRIRRGGVRPSYVRLVIFLHDQFSVIASSS